MNLRAIASRRLLVIMGRTAAISPRAALLATRLLAPIARFAAFVPNADDIRRLFPEVSAERIPGIVRHIRRSHLRMRLLGFWMVRRGAGPVSALVRPSPAVEALRPPAILGVFHVGPTLALSTASARLTAPVYVMRGVALAMQRAPHVEVAPITETEQGRAATFYRAIEYLKTSRFALMAFDPNGGGPIAVPFLGGTLHLARGPFALARLTNAPIIPIVPRWIVDEVELITGDPIAPRADEEAMAREAAAWLERYLREHPEELSYRVIDLLSAAT